MATKRSRKTELANKLKERQQSRSNRGKRSWDTWPKEVQEAVKAEVAELIKLKKTVFQDMYLTTAAEHIVEQHEGLHFNRKTLRDYCRDVFGFEWRS